MKKIINLSLILGAGILFSACVPQLQKEQTQEQAQNEIMKAMQKGGSVYCQLQGEDGDKLEYWLKNGKVKAKGKNLNMGSQQEETEQVGYLINDGKFMYTWAEGESKGVKMKMPDEEEMKEMAQDAKELEEQLPDFTSEEVVKNYEDQGYTVNCKAQNVADSEFTPPASVNFADYSEMMEAGLQMGKEMMEDMDAAGLQEMGEKAEEWEQKAEEMKQQYGF